MTDNEIIKALECCYASGRCAECPLNSGSVSCIKKMMSHTLDLINRQKAEIERLQKENTFHRKTIAENAQNRN